MGNASETSAQAFRYKPTSPAATRACIGAFPLQSLLRGRYESKSTLLYR
jgi:hypothetical protein